MKIYALSHPLNERSSFWPYSPPFEVKYIKRKAEHGVNAQYIMTSNHMGTHLDAPRHFVTAGKTIDELPLEWLCGPGVIVRSEEHTSELQSRLHLVCRLLLEKKKKTSSPSKRQRYATTLTNRCSVRGT